MGGPRRVVELAELGAAAAAVDRAVAAAEPLVLTRDGCPVAVVLRADLYARGEEERAQLRLLALGEMEAAAGEGHDAAEVIADARSLLAEN